MSIKYLTTLFAIILSFTCKAQTFEKDSILNIVKLLSSDSLEGRKTGGKGSLIAQKLITGYYEKLNIKCFEERNFIFNFKIKNGIGKNIIGYIPGRKNPDRFIVVSAHYDHLGIVDGKVFNGADDNASGIGGLLAVANYFSINQPENSIVFAAFDAEELDLLGSKAFLNNPPVPQEKIAININMDMISRSDKNEIYACGTYYNPYLKTLLSDCCSNKEFPILKFGHDNPNDSKMQDWTLSSDHGPFHEKHIPFIYFGVEDHDDYHKSSDDFNRINKEFYISTINLIITSIATIDVHLTEIEKRRKLNRK